MQSTRKGFTLIELMIVIAIIAIIAAIAIPNLMQSRIRANEATAVSAIKQYASAQVTFQVGKQGRNSTSGTTTGASGFADNFRNLFYAPAVGQDRPMALLAQAVADAPAGDPFGGAIATAVAATASSTTVGAVTAYQGYFFLEPQNLDEDWYATNFALFAVPANSSSTGNNAYWLDQQGTVYMKGLVAGDDVGDSVTAVGSSTPSKPSAANDYTGWDAL